MTQPIVVITGTPDWADDVTAQISGEYDVHFYTIRTHYVANLTSDRVAMIMVDGASEGWRFWTATPKSSPATRRIPIIMVADDPGEHAEGLTAGADLAITVDEVREHAGDLVHNYARIPDPDMLEQLDCECDEALPPLAREGVEKFNAGQYYKQHDLFEEQWMKTEGPVRDLYRAILQIGVAYYQIERDNYRGALKMLQRSVQWISVLPDVCQGIDVKQLREDSYRVRAELERLGEANFSAFDRSLIQPLRLVEDDD